MLGIFRRPKCVGLALSGGAVRGLAHLGVLKVLEEAEIEVDVVSGTSAGSFVGAFVAAGLPVNQILDVAERMSWAEISSPRVPRLGFLTSTDMDGFLKDNLKVDRIEDLAKPYAATAVSLTTGECVAFTQGLLAKAVMASTCIPGVFAPVQIDGQMFVDGGLLSFDPVKEAKELGADYVISVRLSTPRRPEQPPRNIIEVMLASFDIAFAHVSDLEPTGDVTIVPDLEGTNPYDFHQREDLIRRGEDAARKHIDRIKRDLHHRR